jgi:hypothetical protein
MNECTRPMCASRASYDRRALAQIITPRLFQDPARRKEHVGYISADHDQEKNAIEFIIP